MVLSARQFLSKFRMNHFCKAYTFSTFLQEKQMEKKKQNQNEESRSSEW